MTAKIICSTCKKIYGETEVSIEGLNITGPLFSHGECGCRGDL